MQQEQQEKKLLLMGCSNSGKTSMYSIIFANYPAKETMGIGLTVGVDEQKIRFMGNLTLNLWDCGGQDKLMKHYFSMQKDQIFKFVEVLIYVFDITKENKELENDIKEFKQCLQLLSQNSKGASVFILIHKLDLVPETEKEALYEKKKNIIQEASSQFIKDIIIRQYYGTSIWDESLYRAWSQIVQCMVPNLENIRGQLQQICLASECEEVVLFEKQSFLIIAYYEVNQTSDTLKYERVSNIIKQFKLSFNKSNIQIVSLHVKNDKFTAIINELTENTNIMVVFSTPHVSLGSVTFNIECAKKNFQLKDAKK